MPKLVSLYLAAACSMGLLLSAPLDQARAQSGELRITIEANDPDRVPKFIEALQMPSPRDRTGIVVIVIELSCGTKLDLTGHQRIFLGSNRKVIASPSCTRGPRTPLDRIPIISVRDNRPFGDFLLGIDGDDVLISGFLIQGPSKDISQGKGRREVAINIAPAECVELKPGVCEALPVRSIEVSNMEIFHWSGAGINVRDTTTKAERGRLSKSTVDAIKIRNNFIHHNRHGAGYGYGIEVATGAYALIERNVFDENRHGIAGGSSDRKKDFSGYTARENLILPGGGLHCVDDWKGFFMCFWQCNCWQTHQVDMHGTKSRTFLGGSCCGIAGETILIERNAILYNAGYAIKIRGNPLDKAEVDGNIFKHSKSDAIAQNGDPGWLGLFGGDNISNPVKVLPNNDFGVDPLAKLNPESDSCDFSGSRDGHKDVFMATGVTWWARSPPEFGGQWRYLNTMPEQRPQLELKDLDGDGICDVVERPPEPGMDPRRYSKSGTGPWVAWTPPPPSNGGVVLKERKF